MAGPITWRNVQGDGGRMAANLLRGGQAQLVGAGDSLLRTLDQFRQINTANAGVIRQNNTQDFLDQVAAVSDPNQLASPEVQAQLEQARLGYGNNIDRGVARQAIPQQLASLQKAAAATQQFNDVQEEVAQRPVLEDLAQKLYSGDTEGYNAVLDSQSLRNEDKLRGALAQRTDDIINQGYRAAGEKRAQGAEGRAIQSFNLSQEVGRENLANSRSERAYRDDQRELNLAQQAIKSITDESAGELAMKQSKNIFATGSQDPVVDAQKILKGAGLVDGEFDTWLGTNEGDRQKIQQATTSLLTDGVTLSRDGKDVKVPIPPALIEQYLASRNGGSAATGEEMGKFFSDMFKDNPELQQRAFDGLEAKQDHNALLKKLKEKDRELRLSKSPDLSRTLDDIKTLRDNVLGFPKPAGNMLPTREEDLNY